MLGCQANPSTVNTRGGDLCIYPVYTFLCDLAVTTSRRSSGQVQQAILLNKVESLTPCGAAKPILALQSLEKETCASRLGLSIGTAN